jgi:hypothetical protein
MKLRLWQYELVEHRATLDPGNSQVIENSIVRLANAYCSGYSAQTHFAQEHIDNLYQDYWWFL